MNYDKIGNFIKEKRKEKNLTQKELASKLGITDKAISKWERGLGFPDVSLLEDLSNNLNISILEILKGENLEKSIQNDETENIIKSTLIISKEESSKKRKKIINRTLLFIIISISLIVVALNIIQIKYLNTEYPFYLSEKDKNEANDKLTKLKENINLIKNKSLIFNSNDKDNLINYLDNNLKEINNNHLLNTTNKKNNIKIKDIYIMESIKGTNDSFRTNDINVLTILKKYENSSILNTYYDYYINNNAYLVYSGAKSHQDSFLLSKYQLSLNKEDSSAFLVANISYLVICKRELDYQISNLLYLTEVVLKVGDIND